MIVYDIDASGQHSEQVGGSNVSLLETHSRTPEAIGILDCNVYHTSAGSLNLVYPIVTCAFEIIGRALVPRIE